VVHRPRTVSCYDAGRVLRRSGQLSCRRGVVLFPAPAYFSPDRPRHASFRGAKRRHRSTTAKCPIGTSGSSQRRTNCSGLTQGHATPVMGSSSTTCCQGAHCFGATAGRSRDVGRFSLAAPQKICSRQSARLLSDRFVEERMTELGRFRPVTHLFLPALVTNAVLAAGRPQAKQIPARVSTLVQHQAAQPVAHRFA